MSKRERETNEAIEQGLLTSADVTNKGTGTLDLLQGEHCSYGLCRQLSFIVFHCDHCKKPHCEKHWKPDQHQCKHVKELRPKIPCCPKCNQALRKPKSKGYAEFLQEHQASGCKKYLRDKKNHCAAKRCKKKATFVCGGCQKKFCVKHRWDDMHSCDPTRVCRSHAGAMFVLPSPRATAVCV